MRSILVRQLQNPVGPAFHRGPRLAVERQPYQNREVLQLALVVILFGLLSMAHSFAAELRVERREPLTANVGVVSEGPTHHFALGIGHHAAELKKVARCLGIEAVVVTPETK